MQKSTSLTGAYLAEGTSNVKQVSKNKKPKKSKKPKIIAAALNLYLKTTPSRKKSGQSYTAARPAKDTAKGVVIGVEKGVRARGFRAALCQWRHYAELNPC